MFLLYTTEYGECAVPQRRCSATHILCGVHGTYGTTVYALPAVDTGYSVPLVCSGTCCPTRCGTAVLTTALCLARHAICYAHTTLLWNHRVAWCCRELRTSDCPSRARIVLLTVGVIPPTHSHMLSYSPTVRYAVLLAGVYDTATLAAMLRPHYRYASRHANTL